MTNGGKVDTKKTLEHVKNVKKELDAHQSKALRINMLLEKAKNEIARALPKHISAERMARVIQTSIKMNPSLIDCTEGSLLGSILLSCQLGLEPNTTGQSYLIPRKNGKTKQMECQFQIGYKGIIELARRSGKIESIDADVICHDEHFEYIKGIEPKFEHAPNFEIDRYDPANIKAFYSLVKFKDGGYHIQIMGKNRVDKIRDKYSQSAQSQYSPWNTEYAQMGLKTVIKHASKFWPISAETQEKINQDERVKDYNKSQDMLDFQDDEDRFIKEVEIVNKEEKLDEQEIEF